MKMRFKLKLITMLALGFFLFCGHMLLSPQEAAAAQPSVVLSGVKGEVLVRKGGGLRELPAVNGMELVQGDWLRTGKGTAKLSYEDGTEATIGSNSSLNIQRLSRSNSLGVSALSETRVTFSEDGHQSSVQLQSGSIWSKVKSLLNMDDSYEVETPTAVMGVRGTLYLVSVNPENGETQGDVIEGVVGVTQNAEAAQAGPIQLVTMGQTLRLVSLAEPLPEHRVIDPQELIRTTQAEILVQLVNDIMERTKELAVLTKEQQQAYGQTGIVDHLKAAIGTSFKLEELSSFGKGFIADLKSSEKLEEVKQVLSENNQSLEQLQLTIDTLKKETEEIRSEVVDTAKKAGVTEEEIKDIEKEAAGVPSSGTVTTPSTPPKTPNPTNGDNGGSSSTSSGITMLLSTDYPISAGTISNVPYGTDNTTFLAKIQKGESHQVWDTSEVHNPVQDGDRIIVTAQNGTQEIFTISITPSELGIPVTLAEGVPVTFSNGVNLNFGDLTMPQGAKIMAVNVSPEKLENSIPEGMALASDAIDFTLTLGETGEYSLEQAVSLSMPLKDGVDLTRVGVYYLNGSTWVFQDSTVLNGSVVALVNHFSIYAVLMSDPDHSVNLISQSVSSLEGTQIKLQFDQPLHSSSKPASNDFLVTSNGSVINVLSTSVDGDSICLNLRQPIYNNDHVEISYAVGPNHIRDLEGNSVQGFNNVLVSTDSLPSPTSFSVSATNGTVSITFNSSYTGTPAASDFIARSAIDNGNPQILTLDDFGWHVDTRTADFTFSPIAQTEAQQSVVVDVLYNGQGPVAAQAFSIGAVVTDAEDTTPPVLTNVTIGPVTVGENVEATSNEEGFLYLVPSVTSPTLEAINLAVTEAKGVKVEAKANSSGNLSTTASGIYIVYAIDLAGNVSSGSMPIIVRALNIPLDEWEFFGLWQVIENNSDIKNEAVGKYVKLPEGDDSGGLLPNAPSGKSYWFGSSASENLYSIGNYMGEQVSEDYDFSGGSSVEVQSGKLISEVFSVPQFTNNSNTVLNFTSWWEIESSNPADFDLMEIYIRIVENENESPEKFLAKLNPVGVEEQPGDSAQAYTSGGGNSTAVWKNYSYDLSQYAGKDIRLVFNFDTIDESFNAFRGWFINEDIKILSVPSNGRPTAIVSGVDFVDVDIQENEIGGSLNWTAPADVTNVTDYVIYASTDGLTKGTKLGEIPVESSNFEIEQDTELIGITHLAVYTKNAAGEAMTGIYERIEDFVSVPVSSQGVAFFQTQQTVYEDSGLIEMEVVRTSSTDAISVGYYTSDGIALAGSDYTATNGTLNFAVGETSKTISIPILSDLDLEGDEDFDVSLSCTAAGIILGQPANVDISDTLLDLKFQLDDGKTYVRGIFTDLQGNGLSGKSVVFYINKDDNELFNDGSDIWLTGDMIDAGDGEFFSDFDLPEGSYDITVYCSELNLLRNYPSKQIAIDAAMQAINQLPEAEMIVDSEPGGGEVYYLDVEIEEVEALVEAARTAGATVGECDADNLYEVDTTKLNAIKQKIRQLMPV